MWRAGVPSWRLMTRYRRRPRCVASTAWQQPHPSCISPNICLQNLSNVCFQVSPRSTWILALVAFVRLFPLCIFKWASAACYNLTNHASPQTFVYAFLQRVFSNESSEHLDHRTGCICATFSTVYFQVGLCCMLQPHQSCVSPNICLRFSPTCVFK